MAKYEQIIKFISYLRNPEDHTPIVLMAYQHEFIRAYCQDFGYYYLFIPKKNGKTTLNAALMLYELWQPKNQCRELYSISVTMKQAKQSFKYACQFIYQDTDLQRIFKIHNTEKRITNRRTGTTWEVISADDKKGRIHSIKPYIVLYDEVSQCREESTYAAIENSIKDDDGKFVMITHAGNHLDWYGYDVYKQAKAIHSGKVNNPAWYVQLYEAPKDSDITDVAVWKACNPALGIIKSEKKMQGVYESAKGKPNLMNDFKTYQLNQWVEVNQNAFIEVDRWDSCLDMETDKILEATSAERDKTIIADLSLKNDLTAIVALFYPCESDPFYRTKAIFLKPSDVVEEHSQRDNHDYKVDIQGGWLELSQGEIIEQGDIHNRIVAMAETYGIQTIIFDDYMAAYMMRDLVNKGYDVINFPNNVANITYPTKYLQELIIKKGIRHDGNTLMRWCIGNVVVVKDRNENYFPTKKLSKGRIDGTIALIMGIGVAETPEEQTIDPNEIYAKL